MLLANMIFFPYKTQLLFEHELALLVALLVFSSKQEGWRGREEGELLYNNLLSSEEA